MALTGADAVLASLSRPEREVVDDTFRVLAISFSYMDGAETVDDKPRNDKRCQSQHRGVDDKDDYLHVGDDFESRLWNAWIYNY